MMYVVKDSQSFMDNPLLKRTHSWVRFLLEKYMSLRSEAPESQQTFYGSSVWKKCRAEYKKSVGGLCERCKAKGIIEPGYIVHHKEYVSALNITDPNVLLNFDNLELLCLNCHNEEHGKYKHKRRYLVDELGKVLC